MPSDRIKQALHRLARVIGESRRDPHKYYWASSDPTPVRFGTKLPRAMNTAKLSKFRKIGERVVERVRKEEFPHRPSRLTSIFVCPSLSGFCAITGGLTGNKTIYEVYVDGSTFLADGGVFTNVCMYATDGENDPHAIEMARRYWRGTKEYEAELPEVLVDGTVTVGMPVGLFPSR